MIGIPIHCKGKIHCTLIVIFSQDQKIQYYDSMNGDGTIYVEAIVQYLQDILKQQLKVTSPNLRDWCWQILSTSPEGTLSQIYMTVASMSIVFLKIFG